MIPSLRAWSVAIAAIALTALAGCAGLGSPGSGPAAEAPEYRVGDRWVYHVEDGFRVKTTWDETHDVIAIGAEGVVVRITVNGPTIKLARTEIWPAPGLVKVGAVYDNETRRFATPLIRLDFPLAEGKTWNQRVDNDNEATRKTGNINRYGHVRRWEKLTTPAGTFDAVLMQVIMRLDDDEFWREATECNYAVWYAPAARAIVRKEKDAQYREKDGGLDGGAVVRIQHAVVELVSFTPGKP